MSVLNQSGEEQVECPLCMEPLEVDDLNFYPCTCLYQICRFCWHRIRTDENGLCPACRKAYPEDPADFKPLSQEEVAKMKAEKRQKDHQRKQKITENRKHLANVRVVQRNLVFVVGLPMRLADAEILKKHEYFGKYGKIHKVVINQSTTYAGSQGPSASAYVTYQRAEDALRAIQSINNIVVDSRVIKTSLGTTKYCSHFMKNQSCPKQDCMYLHDLGDPEASFTKEQMQQGKHQEFEKKLHEQLIRDSANNNNTNITNNNNRKNLVSPSPPVGTIIITTPSEQNEAPNETNQTEQDTSQQNKEAWPSLSQETLPGSTGTSPTPSSMSSETSTSNDKKNFSKLDNNRALSSHSNSTSTSSDDINIMSMTSQLLEEEDEVEDHQRGVPPPSHLFGAEQNGAILPAVSMFDNVSFFPSTNTKVPPPTQSIDFISSTLPGDWSINSLTDFSDVLPPMHSNEDWQTVFGFRNNNSSAAPLTPPHQYTHTLPQTQSQQHHSQHHSPLILANHMNNTASLPTQQQMSTNHVSRHHHHDDELGFDPFHETQKALAEMIEKEERTRLINNYQHQQNLILRERERLSQVAHAQAQLQQQQQQQNSFLDSAGLFATTPNHYSNKLNTSNLYNNTLSNCTKLLDNFCLGSSSVSSSQQSQMSNPVTRSRYPTPPGFSQPYIQIPSSQQTQQPQQHSNSSYIQHNSFTPKFIENSLNSVDMGSKLLPFVHQSSSSLNFQHSLNPPAPAWDWTALDPAIMSAGQHCDLFTTPPPPGFTLRQTLDNF